MHPWCKTPHGFGIITEYLRKSRRIAVRQGHPAPKHRSKATFIVALLWHPFVTNLSYRSTILTAFGTSLSMYPQYYKMFVFFLFWGLVKIKKSICAKADAL